MSSLTPSSLHLLPSCPRLCPPAQVIAAPTAQRAIQRQEIFITCSLKGKESDIKMTKSRKFSCSFASLWSLFQFGFDFCQFSDLSVGWMVYSL